MNEIEHMKLFKQKLIELKKQQPTYEDMYKISFEILQFVQDKYEEDLNKLNDKIEKLKTPRKPRKKKKISLPIENKIIKLITVYRKTTNEIKEIILEENKTKISDRTIIEIKKKNNIKGYKVIV